jgi:anaerobic selenocysteine-containing dehydrogenase
LQHGGWWPEMPEGARPEPVVNGPVAVSPAAFQGDEKEYPYFLHLYLSVLLSDGSGASLPWLQGAPDPLTTISWQTWVELNPETAQELGVENGDIVKIESPHGEIEAPVYVFPAIRPDTVAIPLGQGHSDYGRYAKQRGSHPMRLIGMELDESGNSLAWANVRVKISKTDQKKALAVFESTVERAEEEVHIPF